MSSTTTTKKEIVDFLWEWAEGNGEWAKLLISKIVSSEVSLSSADQEEVFNYFMQSIDLHKGLPPLSIAKPAYTPTSKNIELQSLTNITGVNKLAKNQTVKFSKNLTVVYGENGTGKTGYGRILKNLGFSYDPNNVIHHNIYGTAESKSAQINFKANGEDKTFDWNGTNKNTELQNISVFNSNCVQISLSDRQLIVSPIGFHLFNLVTGELNELSKMLTSKLAEYPTTLTWAELLTDGTPQQKFISELSGKSSEKKLTELSDFTTEHEKELKEKEVEQSNLNKTLLETEIQNLTACIQELDTLKKKIENAEQHLNAKNWAALLELNKQITELEGKTQLGIKDIAETKGVEFYTTEEFQAFIKAADNYINVLNKSEYPQQTDHCVYCLQPLESSARELLASYRTLLNDKSQENLANLKKSKTDLIALVTGIDTSLSCHQGTFGMSEEGKPVQPFEITEYNRNLGALKSTFSTDKAAPETTFSFDYQKQIKFLSEKRTKHSEALKAKQDLLQNLIPRERELNEKIAELKDRKTLSTKVKDIKTSIANHKTVTTLKAKTNSFSSTSISRKTTEARQHLVEQNFNDIFQSELKHLRKSDLPIKLNFGTDKGKSKITHRLSTNYQLIEILSEGEQKAISLAEFLTELQLDHVQGPVIFDDPVNSLDHHIIDEVGKRLIELSKNRQVIIFTHSILLLNSLKQQSELKTNKVVKFQFHRVKKNFDNTGVIEDGLEAINSFNDYKTKLNSVISTKAGPDIDEAKLAAEGYGHLRSALEITVEESLLKNTIIRYRKGVAFPSLLRIDGGKLDAHKGQLNDIYEKCCVSIDGHSSPEELHTTPTINDLKADWEEFQKIRANFN